LSVIRAAAEGAEHTRQIIANALPQYARNRATAASTKCSRQETASLFVLSSHRFQHGQSICGRRIPNIESFWPFIYHVSAESENSSAVQFQMPTWMPQQLPKTARRFGERRQPVRMTDPTQEQSGRSVAHHLGGADQHPEGAFSPLRRRRRRE